jgi:hypothetical protein
MSRRYQRVALGRQWVKSCPLMSISPACGRTCGRLVPVVMAVPPTAMPAVWQVGGVVRGAAARRLRCAPGRIVLIGLVVGRNGTLVGDGGGFCVVFYRVSVDCAATGWGSACVGHQPRGREDRARLSSVSTCSLGSPVVWDVARRRQDRTVIVRTRHSVGESLCDPQRLLQCSADPASVQ